MFELSRYPYISLDTETDGVDWPISKMFGFSIATPDGKTCYHDIRHEPERADDLRYELSSYNGIIIYHNASFDIKMLHSAGIYAPIEQSDDTVIRACLLNEHEHSFSLDALSQKYLKDSKVDIYPELAKLFGGKATRNAQMKNLHRAPPDLVGRYAIVDALLTLRLWEWQEKEIEKQGIRQICDFERRVIVPLIKAEMRGVKVDTRLAEQAMAKLTLVIDEEQERLNKLAGEELNANSPKQVRAMFNPTQDATGEWFADNGTHLISTDSGNPSIDAEALRRMETDERAKLLLSVRSTVKTRDTFLGGHVLGHAVGDRVYPTINQNKGEDAGTGSGRLSYTAPALQQIPSRNKKVASIVKPVFLPDDGCDWMSLDMNSYEVRVFAHLVNDPQINLQYKNNPLSDFHQMVADLTNLPRNATFSGQPNAKQLNLSMIFNSGNGAIAEKMGMPWDWHSFTQGSKIIKYKKAGDEAEAVIAEYHRALPGVKDLAKRGKAAAEAHGFVQTKHGRRLRFPHGYKSYKASGLAIQATAADISKEIWLLLDKIQFNGHNIMSVHDSFELNVAKGTNALQLRDSIQEQLIATVPWFRVPLVIDLNGVGANYYAAQKG